MPNEGGAVERREENAPNGQSEANEPNEDREAERREEDSPNEQPENERQSQPPRDPNEDDDNIEGRALSGLRFKLRDGLVFFVQRKAGQERLCIPPSVEKDIFELCHDRQFHAGFHRAYEKVAASFFIRQLTKRLKAYVAHCPQCLLNQTKRHKPYGEMQPVPTPDKSFHTITVDWIVALQNEKDYDQLMTVTDKFDKGILLIPGNARWKAPEWARVFVRKLVSHDWGIPSAIISDRDTRFLSEFWRHVFEAMGTKLLAATAYHPQTDGQSERTNQSVEIAMRFAITENPDKSWLDTIPFIQAAFNNATNASTGLAPNEIRYGFKTNTDPLNCLRQLPPDEYTLTRDELRQAADEVIAFTEMIAKHRYDSKHKPIEMQVGDRVFLRLHDGYGIPGVKNPKLGAQRCGSFPIVRKVGKLAYELKLPPTMKIHPVVSISQLEPAPEGSDPYERVLNAEPPPVVEVGTPDEPEWEVERLVDRKWDGRRRCFTYLVKYLGWGPEQNEYQTEGSLTNAKELMDEYDEKYPRPPINPETGKPEDAAGGTRASRGRGRPRRA